MITMIEHIARSIDAAELKWKHENGGDDASCADCPAEVKARAAVEAMREITPHMERAFHASRDEHGHVLWKSGYRAVVDAILEEQGESK